MGKASYTLLVASTYNYGWLHKTKHPDTVLTTVR